MSMAEFWIMGILRSSVASGASFEEAVTVLSSVPPASSSSWVKVCVAEQVMLPPIARVVYGQLMSLLSLSSDRTMPLSVTFPMLITR